MGQKNQKSRWKYWATRLSVCSFAHTAHSFAWSTLLASLMRSTALTCLLARSLCSFPSSWKSKWLDSFFFWVFSYSGPKCHEQEWVQRRIKFSSTLTLVINTRKPFWPYPHLRDPATSSHSSRPQKRASSSKACVMWRVNTILYNESIYNWRYCFFIDSLCLNFDA